MVFIRRAKKKFIYFSAEKYNQPQRKEVLILNTSDLAFFSGNDMFNVNLLGLGEAILWLSRLSNPIFLHLEKISVCWALQRK